MWSNESAVELHACHPSSHVTGYGHIKVRHIVCSVVIVPWSPRKTGPRILGVGGVLQLLTVVEDVNTRYGWSSIIAFARRPSRHRGLDFPYHRFRIHLYLRTIYAGCTTVIVLW